MLALMQQSGEKAVTAVPKDFDNEGRASLLETDIPVAVWLADGERWLARIQNLGQEHTFTLRAETKDTAVAEAGIIYDTIRTTGWDAALLSYSSREPRKKYSSSDEEADDWQARLQLRRHTFPPAGGFDKDWAVRLDHAGMGYWFPLGTANREAAAEKARLIYQTVSALGWEMACRRHPRELILNFEWCSSPVLWTYTTIHTLVGRQAFEASPALPGSVAHRVIVVETDDGIRRALQWCINQQAGFQSVACAAPETFSQLCSIHQPSLVLLNRNLAKNLGMESTGGIVASEVGAVIVGYSVCMDDGQMFVSPPDGTDGCMFKRVEPANVFDPVLSAVRRGAAGEADFTGAVRRYFKKLLRARMEKGARSLGRLTSRENEVLKLLSKGYSNREIAQALSISFWTVHEHLKKIFQRLRVHTRTEAAARYLE